MINDVEKYQESERRRNQADDKATAGDIFPNCACFNNPVGETQYLSLAGDLGNKIANYVAHSNVCPAAVPYFMAQAISVYLAKLGVLDAAELEASGATDEQVVRKIEDTMAEHTAKVAFLIPKLVANHAVAVRRQISMLGEMAIAAVRVDTPESGS